jgi:hypothetical protein
MNLLSAPRVRPLRNRPLPRRPPRGVGQFTAPNDNFDTGWASVFVAGCNAIGASPLEVAELLLSESGFDPSARNSIGCVGLNQLCSSSYGIFSSDYTVDQYVQLTVSEQLPYVFAYWQNWLTQYGLGSISARDLYWLNFLPATYVPNSSDDYVISSKGDPYYSSNTGLDMDGNGQITAGDLQARLDAMPAQYPNLWPYLELSICEAGGCFSTTGNQILAGLALGVAGFFAWKAMR